MGFILPNGFRVKSTPRTVGKIIITAKTNRLTAAISKPLVDVYQEELIIKQ